MNILLLIKWQNLPTARNMYQNWFGKLLGKIFSAIIGNRQSGLRWMILYHMHRQLTLYRSSLKWSRQSVLFSVCVLRGLKKVFDSIQQTIPWKITTKYTWSKSKDSHSSPIHAQKHRLGSRFVDRKLQKQGVRHGCWTGPLDWRFNLSSGPVQRKIWKKLLLQYILLIGYLV